MFVAYYQKLSYSTVAMHQPGKQHALHSNPINLIFPTNTIFAHYSSLHSYIHWHRTEIINLIVERSLSSKRKKALCSMPTRSHSDMHVNTDT